MKIRRIIRKLAAVTGYVLLLCYFLGAKWTQLFDIRMIGLFFAGVLLLCIPFLGKNRKQVNWHEVIGSNALTAGYIEAFMLLFSTMSTSELMREGLLCEMGLDLRPILYGYILHIVLSRPPVTMPLRSRRRILPISSITPRCSGWMACTASISKKWAP